MGGELTHKDTGARGVTGMVAGQNIMGDNFPLKVRVSGNVTTFWTLSNDDIILKETVTDLGSGNKDWTKQVIVTDVEWDSI
jgi:hypothetical protein